VTRTPRQELWHADVTRTDPFATYDLLRAGGPLETSPGRWILLGHDDVRAAFADHVRFSSDIRRPDNPVFANTPLVFDDPPRHTKLRRLVSKVFTPSRIAALEPAIRATASELLDTIETRARGGGARGDDPRVVTGVELVEEYADPLPVVTIAMLLGIPVDRHREFKRWSHARATVTYQGPGADAQADRDIVAMDRYLADLAATRRAEPGDDLLSALTATEVDGVGLTDTEIAGLATVILTAGNLTTTRLIANVVHALATGVVGRLPGLVGFDRRDSLAPPARAAIAALVEESLRIDSPVQVPARRTTVDVAYPADGVTIPAGSFVMLGVGAANRDPAAFDEPAAFVPGRSSPHLAFGHGIHVCLGAALARLEAVVTVDLLLERYQAIELDGEPSRTPGLTHRGFDHLPLRFTRRDRSAQRP
jgi:cytochrome P450